MVEPASAALLHALREAHRRVDAQIAALVAAPGCDQLEIARLKRQKLRLRDELARAEDSAIPDLIA